MGMTIDDHGRIATLGNCSYALRNRDIGSMTNSPDRSLRSTRLDVMAQ
jgi:hypothetical protein